MRAASSHPANDPVEAIRKRSAIEVGAPRRHSGTQRVNVLLRTEHREIPEVMAELRRQKFRGLVGSQYERRPGRGGYAPEVEFARKLAG
jgi:hypothetical protein